MSKTTLIPYLFYAGRCDEAIAFYRDKLGAEVEILMRNNESPVSPPPGMLQPGFEAKVMHATVRMLGVTIMMADGCDDKNVFDGFRLALTLPTEAEAHRVFDALSDGGSVLMPLTQTFWSPLFGMVTDRFNVGWMISIPGPSA